MDICRLVIVAAMVMPIAAGAKTIYVDNKLDDYTGHNGTSWALAYHRIQDAVTNAVSGDTVLVAPGVYGDDQGTVIDNDPTGNNSHYSYQKNRIWINGKSITLKSSTYCRKACRYGIRHRTRRGQVHCAFRRKCAA